MSGNIPERSSTIWRMECGLSIMVNIVKMFLVRLLFLFTTLFNSRSLCRHNKKAAVLKYKLPLRRPRWRRRSHPPPLLANKKYINQYGMFCVVIVLARGNFIQNGKEGSRRPTPATSYHLGWGQRLGYKIRSPSAIGWTDTFIGR